MIGYARDGMRVGIWIHFDHLGDGRLADIPEADRLLEIRCPVVGGRGRGQLVAVVTRDLYMHVMSKQAMGRRVLVVCAPCQCPDRGHEIDVYKATAALERLRYGRPKARWVDVTRLAPDL